ncbi:hypothetical protein B0T25DRAFT_224206 [Lasiosphaeria hispida]|uniref:Uncharacterized protein n=1 Tax=Lasiosphaeria hispida TaxID=260671 RepID=A0AAJ0HK15_9PEZI|nr:hypothetical protein B0T25DRAFT_224206 [Lasiosphaeria hispida]
MSGVRWKCGGRGVHSALWTVLGSRTWRPSVAAAWSCSGAVRDCAEADPLFAIIARCQLLQDRAAWPCQAESGTLLRIAAVRYHCATWTTSIGLFLFFLIPECWVG